MGQINISIIRIYKNVGGFCDGGAPPPGGSISTSIDPRLDLRSLKI